MDGSDDDAVFLELLARAGSGGPSLSPAQGSAALQSGDAKAPTRRLRPDDTELERRIEVLKDREKTAAAVDMSDEEMMRRIERLTGTRHTPLATSITRVREKHDDADAAWMSVPEDADALLDQVLAEVALERRDERLQAHEPREDYAVASTTVGEGRRLTESEQVEALMKEMMREVASEGAHDREEGSV